MANPTPSDVHVNAPLTNISVAFIQSAGMYVASQVFPIVPVSKQSDRYFVYDIGDFYRSEAKKRGPGSESAGNGFRIDNTPSYFADVFAVHKDIDDQLRANADMPINVDRDATEFITQQLLIRRENEFATSYMATGIWDTDLTGVAAAPGAGQFLQWDNDTSNPIKDITDQVIAVTAATGFKPNTLVLAPKVFNALKHHPDFVDRIKYTEFGSVTVDMIARVLELDRVLIGWGVENSAKEEAADSIDYIFGKDALLVYSAPRPSILAPSAGYTFSWTGLLGAGAFGNRIKRFRMEQLASDRVEGEMAFDLKVVASSLGVFFDEAVS